MRRLLKSPLKKAANNISRIGFSPRARRVRAFDFDRKSEYVKFVDFIKNSTQELKNADLPSKRQLKKITNFDVVGGGGGGAGLLGLLGLGGLGLGLGAFKLPKINIPFTNNPFNNPKGRRPRRDRGRNQTRPDSRGRRRGDRNRDSRNQRRNRRTRNNTTQRPGRGVSSREEARYRRRFGDRAGDRKFGKLNQGRVQNRGFRSPFRQRPQVSGTGADRFRQGVRQRIPGQGARVTGGNVDRALNSRSMRAVRQAGRFGLKGGRAVIGASRAMLRGVRRIPVIGSIIAGVFTYFQDIEGGNNPDLPGGGPDGKPDMNLSRALFSAGGAALGGVLGSFIPIPVIGTMLGGIIGEYIGELAYELLKGGGVPAVGQRLKKDLQKLLEVGGAVGGWAKDGFKRLYKGLPKVKLPPLHPWLKAIDIGKVLQLLPWGKEVPDPSILFDIKKQAQIFMKIPRAFFSRDPMDGSKSSSAPESESETKKRMIGQEATLNGKPVVWDGNKWVAPEVLEDRGIDRIDDQDDQDLGLTPMSNTVSVGLKDLVSVDAMTGKRDPGGPIMTSGRGMRMSPTKGRMIHHAGVDIGTGHEKGWYVAFKIKGKVSLVEYLGGYGNAVFIEADGKDFIFGHLARPSDLRPGQIYNGQIIGEIGNTGAGTGEHLHFEVRTAGGGRGTDMDPMPYVKYLMIGRLGTGTPQTMLARAESSPSVANDGTIRTNNRGGSQVVNPATGEVREIAADPRREQQKNAGQIFMESIAQLASVLAAQPEPEQSKPKIATLPVPAPQGENGNNKGQTTSSMQQVASSQALNSYWQATLFTKLSV
jgi:murein DD-endopeptidase MepM/ murein hydrolase activator NlpD